VREPSREDLHLRVARRVTGGDRLVARLGDDALVQHEHRAERMVTGRDGLRSQLEAAPQMVQVRGVVDAHRFKRLHARLPTLARAAEIVRRYLTPRVKLQGTARKYERSELQNRCSVSFSDR
jgi:hypothetical protein